MGDDAIRKGNEILPLTGVRAFGAYGVLLTHFHGDLLALVPAFTVLAPIYSRGGLGVDLFFVLSGYIISHVYGPAFLRNIRENYWTYLGSRFARIYPNYFVTLTLLVVLVLLAGMMGVAVQGDYRWGWLVAHYLMLQSVPGVPGGWNFPGWSIGAEFFAYTLVFPAFILAIRACKPPAWLAFAAFPICLLAFWMPKLMGSWGNSEHLPMVTSEFLAGALVWYSCRESGKIASLLKWAIPLLLFGLFAVFALPAGWGGGTDRVFIVLMFPAILGGLARSAGIAARVLASPVIVYLGKTSYALYLVHAIVQKILKPTAFRWATEGGGQLEKAGVFVLYLVLPLVAASLLYHVVEEPARSWLRSVFAQRARRGRERG